MPLPEYGCFNETFVKTIENFKCIYDTTSSDYGSKDDQEKAWTQIAQLFGSTEAECKVRWKHIRDGLTRFLRKLNDQSPGGKRLRKFYLWDVIQFLIPHLKVNKQIDKSLLPTTDDFAPQCKYEETETDNGKDEDPENDNFIDHASDNFAEAPGDGSETSSQPECNVNISTFENRGVKRTHSLLNRSIENSIADYISKGFNEKDESPDLLFFKSIVPDMADFSVSQKRRFKYKVLKLLDEISSEDATQPLSPLSTPSTSSH